LNLGILKWQVSGVYEINLCLIFPIMAQPRRS